jgi:hypothetical protein
MAYMVLITWTVDLDSTGKVASEMSVALTASHRSMPFFDVGEAVRVEGCRRSPKQLQQTPSSSSSFKGTYRSTAR